MKVLMVNGSSRPNGCTYTALLEVGKTLVTNGIEYEIIQLGNQPIRDCIGCNKCKGNGCIFTEDAVNEFVQKAKEADGFVFGSPVYYAHPSGRLLSFLDRAFYCAEKETYLGKPGAAVVSARRAGTTAAIDVLNKYFTISSMPVVSSTYWNMVHGNLPEDVEKDFEGLQTMRNIGTNMAWIIKKLRNPQLEVNFPVQESGNRTNFIR